MNQFETFFLPTMPLRRIVDQRKNTDVTTRELKENQNVSKGMNFFYTET